MLVDHLVNSQLGALCDGGALVLGGSPWASGRVSLRAAGLREPGYASRAARAGRRELLGGALVLGGSPWASGRVSLRAAALREPGGASWAARVGRRAGAGFVKRVRECSLGERSRLPLARLVLRGCNLLLLDEPINHLDVDSREHFEAALDAFEGTVIVVAHDRAFVRSFARHTFAVKDGQVRPA